MPAIAARINNKKMKPTSGYEFETDAGWARRIKIWFCQFVVWLFPEISLTTELSKDALKKTSIFIMESASLMDYALFVQALRKQGVSAPLYLQSAPCSIWGRLWHKLSTRKPTYDLLEYVRAGKAVVLHLKTPTTLLTPEVVHQQKRQNQELLKLVDWLQEKKEITQKLRIVPLLCLWSREPEQIVARPFDRVFGNNVNPGYIRKLCQVIYNRKLVHLYTGAPIDLEELRTIDPNSRHDVRVGKLRKSLSKALANQRRVATGPVQKWKRRIIELVIRDKDLSKTMKLVAHRQSTSIDDIQDQARQMLDELAAEYSAPHTDLMHIASQQLQKRCFKNLHVDADGIKALRSAAATGYPLILLPTHKSHMDYMLISDILYVHGINPPHIAAGINLKFWPVGYFFRRAGAFFIRRQVTDLLYTRLLGAYVRRLVKEGYSQEFYIEGGRSRDGKLILPKLGILGMSVDAFWDKVVDDLIYIPLNIGYDKVLEDTTYARELRGTKKASESFFGMLRAFKHLRRKHGNIYVRFGNPISLKQMHADICKSSDKQVKRRLVKQLAKDVTADLNRMATVSPTSITSMSLLAYPGQARDINEIEEDARILLDIITHEQKVYLAPELSDIKEGVKTGMDLLCGFDDVEKITLPQRVLYKPFADRQLILAYYKNGALHHLLAEALFSLALGHGQKKLSKETILERMHFLVTLTKREFTDLSDDDLDVDAIYERGCATFLRLRLIKEGAHGYNLNAWNNCKHRQLLQGLLMPYLEAALAVCEYMSEQPTPAEAEDDTEALVNYWQQAFFRGGLKHSESCNKAMLATLLQSIREINQADGNTPNLRQFGDYDEISRYIQGLIA